MITFVNWWYDDYFHKLYEKTKYINKQIYSFRYWETTWLVANPKQNIGLCILLALIDCVCYIINRMSTYVMMSYNYMFVRMNRYTVLRNKFFESSDHAIDDEWHHFVRWISCPLPLLFPGEFMEWWNQKMDCCKIMQCEGTITGSSKAWFDNGWRKRLQDSTDMCPSGREFFIEY